MQKVGNPVPIFIDARGMLVDNGSIFVGQANADPEVNPIACYWDEALTVPVQQPIKTLGGFIVNGTNPAEVFISQDDYSMRLEDASGSLVFYSPSVFLSGVQFQPLDADLTTISGQTNAPFGMNLLTLANLAAAQSALGISAFTGGTVTTNIIRQGAGVHPYYSDAGMTGGRIFVTAVGAADPTSLPGDLWLIY